MNSCVERVKGTIRREPLNHFLLLSEKQVRNIISEYVEYYNNQRFHQWIAKIPNVEIQEQSGALKKLKYYPSFTITTIVQVRKDEKE